MRMTERERLLAVVVGGLAVVVVAFMALMTVTSAFSSANSRLRRAESDLKERQRKIRLGAEAATQLAAYGKHSLPADLGDARAEYKQWLYDAWVETMGSDPTVKSSRPVANKDIYHQISFTMSGNGNIDQLTQFLYRFYSVGTLHRIRTLLVDPVEESKDLQVTLDVDALSLPGAAEQATFGPLKGNRLGFEKNQLVDYRDAILGRNLFAPANRSPRLDRLSGESATTKRQFTMRLRAVDADPLDKMFFSLGEDSPLDAEIRQRSNNEAELVWTPPSADTFHFTVFVNDDGFPSLEDSGSFELNVTDPQPEPVQPEPSFDVARYTLLTGILQGRDGQFVIWLDEKPSPHGEDNPHKLREGDEFEIGSVKGVVREIRIQDAILEIGGKPVVLSKGNSLTQTEAVGSRQ